MFDRRLAEQLLLKKDIERHLDDRFNEWVSNMENFYLASLEQKKIALDQREREIEQTLEHYKEERQKSKVLLRSMNLITKGLRVIERYEKQLSDRRAGKSDSSDSDSRKPRKSRKK